MNLEGLDTRTRELAVDQPGLPRPRAQRRHRDDNGEVSVRNLPVPWILSVDSPSDTTDAVQWTTFDPTRAYVAHADQLCQVCGEPVTGDKILLCGRGSWVDDTEGWRASGPLTHPICAELTVRHCPHFDDWDHTTPVGWHHRKPERGYVDQALEPEETFELDVIVDDDIEPITFRQLQAIARS